MKNWFSKPAGDMFLTPERCKTDTTDVDDGLKDMMVSLVTLEEDRSKLVIM